MGLNGNYGRHGWTFDAVRPRSGVIENAACRGNCCGLGSMSSERWMTILNQGLKVTTKKEVRNEKGNELL